MDKELQNKHSVNVNNRISYVLAILFLVCIFLFDLFYAKVHYLELINSDTAAELILGKKLAIEGGWLSKTWYYSTELRVLNTQIVYKLMFMLFPDNWRYVKLFSMAILLLVLVCSAIFAMRQIIGKPSPLIFLFAAAIICPLGNWYAWNVIFNLYYVPHIVISFLSLGLLCMAIRSNKHKKIACYLALAVVGLVAGMGGLRQLMICYAPMGVALVLFGIDVWNGKGSIYKEKIIDGILLLASLLFSVIGYVINGFLATEYSFKDLSDNVWEDFSVEGLLKSLSDLLKLFGWKAHVEILSIEGIGNVVSICLILIFTSCIIWLIKREKREIELTYYNRFIVSALLVQTLVYGLCNKANESYWIPTIPLIIEASFIAANAMVGVRKKVLSYTTMLMILICSMSTLINPIPEGVPTNLNEMPAISWIKEKGYDKGLATFWYSDFVTEVTDGSIEMYTLTNEIYPIDMYEWLQDKNHSTEDVNSDMFVLLSLDEYSRLVNDGVDIISSIEYQDEYFVVGNIKP